MAKLRFPAGSGKPPLCLKWVDSFSKGRDERYIEAMIYDTLKLSKALRVSFTPEQSDTLAQAFSESTEDNVATKRDIAELKTEIADLRTELKTEIADLRAELKTQIAGVRNEIANLKVDMVRWIVGAIAFNLLGTIGIMIAVAELVLRAK